MTPRSRRTPPDAAPPVDVTASVMKRLGYVPATTVEARRWKWAVRARRAACGLSVMAIVAVAARLHMHSFNASASASVSIPEAVRSAYEEKRGRFQGFMRTLRDLTPDPSNSEPAAPAHETSAMAPFVWV
jgi:hypothetical protein